MNPTSKNRDSASRMTMFLKAFSAAASLAATQLHGASLSENFDSMASGTTPPTGWSILNQGSGSPNDKTLWTASNPIVQTGVTMNVVTPLNLNDAPTTTLVNGYNALGASGLSGDRCIATSPTGTASCAIQSPAWVNGSGGNVTSFDISYDIRRLTAGTEEVPGFWLFYSVDGGSTWTNVTALNPTLTNVPNTTGTTSIPVTSVSLSSPWTIGGSLRLRWVDDNATASSPDQIIGLDNVTIQYAPFAVVPVTLLSQNFSSDPVNYTLTGNSSPFRFDPALTSRYWAKSDTADMTLNPGITGNAGVYLATQNIDGGTVTFSAAEPAQIDFNVDAGNYTNLKLAIALAAMPNAEAGNFIRAKTDNDGDGSYETTLFEFKGSSNSAYTDATLGALTAAFKSFSNIALPVPTAVDRVLRLRIESFNDTESLNEATGIDSILITGTPSGPVVLPTVALTAPIEGASVFIPGTTTLTATAADADGSVGKVEFFDGAAKLGEDLSAPYEFVWSPVGLGAHVLAAKATDNNGNIGTSAPVNVTAVVNPNQPPVVTPTAPADEITGIGNSTTIRVSVDDPEHAATTVTFYGRKTTPPAPGPDFTLMTLPDTQFYSQNTGGQRADTYHAQTQWITDNRDTLNVAFVSHMGDIVQNGDFGGNPIEWKVADAAMKRIENQPATLRPYGIPWGGAPGNHDFGTGGGTGTSLFYNQYFGASRYAGRNYFGGNYGVNNNNNYQFFSASGLDFIILHLEYNAGSVASYQAVLDWADALLKAHPDRRAIVTSHWMVNTGNPATFSTQGQAIYDNLKDNPNLFLLLGGHVHGEGQRSDVFSGRTVHSVLQDYQGRANGGDGWLRYFVFSPASNTISARTYRVANTITPTALFETDADSQFTLSYNMQSAVTGWIPLGTVKIPANGTVANLSWTGLEAGSRYEWYASASDGINTGTGATRRLSTAAPGHPTVSLTNPAGGTSYALPATVPITATAGGSVARVEFFAGNTRLGEDTAAPYEFNWTNPPPGTHLLTAVASDGSGHATLSNTVSISSTGVAPTTTLTSPADGAAATAPATIDFVASAADGDGSVVKVEFYQGVFKVGESTTVPYSFAWTNVAPGTYQLSAVATDNSGITTASNTVSFVVNPDVGSGAVTRGPYLQKAAPTQMTICWRGSQSAVGRVRYGTHPSNLAQFKDDAAVPAAPFDHAITLTGLTAATAYYYSIGSATDTLAIGEDYTFTTPPVAGTPVNTRIWALGDAGTSGDAATWPDASQIGVRDAFYAWTGTHTPDLVLQLGDNAYDKGTDAEFQKGMFDIYPTMLRKTPFWPCLGNHETAQSTSFVDTYPYFAIYDLPTAGECGGAASGTEHYYSFNYGNIHFICLDSMTASRNTIESNGSDGPMALWLRNDLASTTATWIISFFHHPPYSKGSHGSDAGNANYNTQMGEMRQRFLPILEAGGVDLVLCGHSHSYERSYLLDGHYGLSGTLTPAMKKNAGDGRPAGNGAYVKPLTGPRDHFGAVYVVSGSAGQVSGGSLNHPAHFFSLNNLGSLVLDVNGTRLDATFLRENSSTPDTFTIIKQGAADSDGDRIPDDYETTHGLDRKNPADAALDSDGDGVSNLDEFVLNTVANASDRYAFSTSYDRIDGTVTVTFPTSVGRCYRVLYSSSLLEWQQASAVVSGTGATMIWTDDGTVTGTQPSATARGFYLVEVTTIP